MRTIESTMLPESGTAPPESPLPSARGVMARRSRVARRWISQTSAVVAGRTIASGLCSYHVPSNP